MLRNPGWTRYITISFMVWPKVVAALSRTKFSCRYHIRWSDMAALRASGQFGPVWYAEFLLRCRSLRFDPTEHICELDVSNAGRAISPPRMSHDGPTQLPARNLAAISDHKPRHRRNCRNSGFWKAVYQEAYFSIQNPFKYSRLRQHWGRSLSLDFRVRRDNRQATANFRSTA